MTVDNFFLTFIIILLFISFLINDAFLQSITFFVISCIIILFTFFRKNISFFTDLKLINGLIFFILPGFFYAFNNESQFFVRDIYYFVNHLVVIFSGIQLAKIISLKKFINTTLLLSIALLVIYFLKLIFLFNFDPSEYIEINSYTAAFVSLFTVSMCLLILLLNSGNNIVLNLIMLLLFLLICTLLDARTPLVSVFLFYVLVLFQEKIKLSKLFFFITYLTMFVIMLFQIFQYFELPMIERFSNSMNEINPYTQFNNLKDINYNWRGFESYLVFYEFSNAPLVNKIFGFGYGKEVYLGFQAVLNNIVFSKIYVFHNGFSNILLKSGIVGLILYSTFFLKNFIVYNKKFDYEKRKIIFSKKYIANFSIVILISTLANGGLLNLSIFPIALSYGFFIHYIKNEE